jgi:hypothetical protein
MIFYPSLLFLIYLFQMSNSEVIVVTELDDQKFDETYNDIEEE